MQVRFQSVLTLDKILEMLKDHEKRHMKLEEKLRGQTWEQRIGEMYKLQKLELHNFDELLVSLIDTELQRA